MTPTEKKLFELQFLEYMAQMKDSPEIIRLAKFMIEHMPRGKRRDELIAIMQKVKHSLIDLDVFLQGLEIDIHYHQLLKNERKKKEHTNCNINKKH